MKVRKFKMRKINQIDWERIRREGEIKSEYENKRRSVFIDNEFMEEIKRLAGEIDRKDSFEIDEVYPKWYNLNPSRAEDTSVFIKKIEKDLNKNRFLHFNQANTELGRVLAFGNRMYGHYHFSDMICFTLPVLYISRREEINKEKILKYEKSKHPIKVMSEKFREREWEREKFKVCALCGFNIGVQTHHITFRCEGGKDEPTNLVDLCPNHHAMAHKNLISKEKLRKFSHAEIGQKFQTNKERMEKWGKWKNSRQD